MVTSPPDALTTADHHTRWPRLQPRMRTRSERHAKSTVGRHGDLQGPSFPKGQGGGKAPGDVDRDPHEVSPLTTTAGRDRPSPLRRGRDAAGLIGDLQTAALVTTDGSIDWFCCPRFDSPSVFGALLDDERGGHFRIRPADKEYTAKQMYLPDTAVLVTRFFTADGLGQVLDFMPPAGDTATDNHRLVRVVQCVRGRMTFDIDVAPRFDYGRLAHRVEVTPAGAVFAADGVSLTLHIVRESSDEHLADATVEDGDVHATLELTAGQLRGVVLESAADGPPREIRPAEIAELLDMTETFWEEWLSASTYTGRWREMIQRAAITLKLMTYAPTGGIVAAPTAGLPEQIGGERNWDYRYTWVRDASFSVHALLRLGMVDEAQQFGGW